MQRRSRENVEIRAAVLYCRVSTRDQAEEGVSLGTQESACRAFCRRKGWRIAKVFEDRGESARSIDRPQFTEMISWCRANRSQVDAVVVYKLDRFSRNKGAFFAVQALLASYGIRVISATEPLEEDSPVARLLEGILASIGEFESDLIGERTRASMEHVRENGYPTSLPPLGYILVRDAARRPLPMQDPDRAPHIARAFRLYSTGLYSRNAVLDLVTRDGLRSKRGGILAPQTFSNMLRNPVYASQIRISSKKGYASGRFPPIIPLDVFNRVQEVLSHKGREYEPRGGSGSEFPLRVFIRCPECRISITGCYARGRHGGRYPYYFCKTSGCRRLHIRKEKLEASFSRLLESLGEDKVRLKTLRMSLTEEMRAWSDICVQKGHEFEDRQEENERQIDRLTRAYIYDKTIDRETFLREKDRLDEESSRLSLEASDLHKPGDIGHLVDSSISLISYAAEMWLRTPREQRQGLQKALFPCGLEYDQRIDGFRTPEDAVEFSVFDVFGGEKGNMAALRDGYLELLHRELERMAAWWESVSEG